MLGGINDVNYDHAINISLELRHSRAPKSQCSHILHSTVYFPLEFGLKDSGTYKSVSILPLILILILLVLL
jgi:hypothetical protein